MTSFSGVWPGGVYPSGEGANVIREVSEVVKHVTNVVIQGGVQEMDQGVPLASESTYLRVSNPNSCLDWTKHDSRVLEQFT